MENTNITKDAWKTLWHRPGGTFAKITAVAAACGIGYGFVKALPWLIAAATNTLFFIGEMVAIGAIILIFSSKEFWKWISLAWLQINRKVVSWFVKIDPISILENGIKELRSKMDIVNNNVVKLEGVLVSMKKDMKSYQDEFEQNVQKRNAAQKVLSDPNLSSDKAYEIKNNFVLINNDIARLETIIKAQQKRINTSEKYLTVMKKLKVVAKFKVKDSESELRWRKQEYEQALRQQTAMKSIAAIMSGGLSKSLEEELALDYISTTVNDSIAEMNQLLDGSNDLLVNFELDSIANIDKVDAILARYEQSGFTSFTNDTSEDVSQHTLDYSSSIAGNIGYNTNNEVNEINEKTLVEIPVKNKYF